MKDNKIIHIAIETADGRRLIRTHSLSWLEEAKLEDLGEEIINMYEVINNQEVPF